MNQPSLKSMLLTASTLIFLSFPAWGQNTDNRAPDNQPQKIAIQVTDGSFAENLRNAKIPAATVADQLPVWLGLPDGYTFVLAEETEDQLGYTHRRYQEYYRGVRIADGMAMVHVREGMITSVNGRLFQVAAEAPVRPLISSELAQSTAQHALGVRQKITAYAPELVFAVSGAASATARLAWELRIDGITTDKKVKMTRVFVDAITGKMIRAVPLIMEGDVNGTAKTLYSGNQTITTDSYSGGYRLIDNARNIETYDVGGKQLNVSDPNQPLFPNPDQYTNTTTNWGKIPMFMSITLQTASNGFTTGIGSSFILASYVGKENMGSTDMITMNPLYSFSGQGSLPTTTQKMYINLSGSSYVSGYLKLAFQNNQVNIVDQITFDVSDMTVGTHSWADPSAAATGTYTVALAKNPALDAHWGIEMTHDFYMQAFNRNSYDGAGSVLRNYVNGMFAIRGTQTNASALPEPYNSMVYGLGDGEMMGPMVALDITGHEFTHLVTGHTANLDYYGESGALNESFSDIMGTCIEFFAKPTDANWLIGEDVLLNGAAALRSMSDPNQSGPEQPDTYNGQYWASTNPSSFDNGGVHINSGVGNYWFYLLTEGGSGTNDLSDYYNVHGIGMEKAQKIAYRTWVFYLTSSSQYLDAYNASLEATTDLFGTNSQEYQSVRQAWYAVGIGDSATAPPNSIPEREFWQANIRLYPNPNSGVFYVDNASRQSVEARISSLTGVALTAMTLQPGRNTVDLSALSKGIYFIRLSTKGQVAYTQKVVIH